MKVCICLMLILVLLVLPIRAETIYEAELKASLSEFIPSEISEAAGGMETLFTEAGVQHLGGEFILSLAGQALHRAIRPALSHFSMLLGMALIIGAVGQLKSERCESIASLVCTMSVALASYSLISEHLTAVTALIDYLTTLMTEMLGAMGILRTLGGNAAAAAVTGSSMLLSLTVLENIAKYVLQPLLMLCFALALVSSISGELRGITSFIRTTFSTVLGFVVMLLMTVIASQNCIAKSADSNLMRTVRFAAGAFIPVVGSAVSEAASTIAGGICMLKSITGTIGVVILLAVTLPVILSLFLERASFHLAAESSRLLGIETVAVFFGELKSLFDLAIGLVCAFSMMFVFSMISFAGSAVAV